MKRILIVDDEQNMRTVLGLLFRSAGYETVACESAEAALAAAREGGGFSAIISDLKLGGMDGIELLKRLKAAEVQTPFVLITAYGTVEKAVEAMKTGAVDVVTKPFTTEMILNIVSRIARMEELTDENQILRQRLGRDELVFRSKAMMEVASLVAKIGPVSTPVLITGESGTGKEVVSRALHEAFAAGRDRVPFVSVNCPAVPENLLESELFGYRRGAFTGAQKDFKGKVELADGGTLFFDEIGDLPPSIQPKLLRLLENKTFEPLGSGQTKRVDIRVLCATNRDLKRMVRDGKFREDLYYRINTFTIPLPALRDRREDIELLAEFFVKRYSGEMRKEIDGFEAETYKLLKAYSWPGNVRELKNVVERAVVLCSDYRIGARDLPAELTSACEELGDRPEAGLLPLPSALDDQERRLLLDTLEREGWNVSAASRKLGITRNTMRYRMQKYGLKE